MPSNYFHNRFSETAQKILRDSEVIASAMAAGIDTQHLLASLANTPGTYSYEALRELTVTPEKIGATIHNHQDIIKAVQGISPDMRRILKAAYSRAAHYDTPTVDSEHILLALVSTKDCNAYQVLTQMDVDPKLLRDQLEDYFEQIHQELAEHQDSAGSEEELEDDEHDHFAQPMLPNHQQAPNRPKTAIEYFTTDLTKLAKTGKLDPVIGRDKETRRVVQILSRRTKNNPVLTGEPGVGKTAIAEGLAQKIAGGEVPSQLADKRVLSLDLALLISGTTYRGQFEERAKKLLDEIIKAGNVVLFLDEIHSIIGAGAAEGSIDMSTILKPALAKGQLRLVGATTNDEYRKYIEKDPALERRVQRVQVEEPSVEETIAILHGLKGHYEKFHNVTINDEAITAAADLSKRYVSDRFLPDKAIDLIDEAAAATQLETGQLKLSNQLLELEKRRAQANSEHQKAAENMEYEKAAEYRVLELRLVSEIDRLKTKLPKRTAPRVINREDIAKIVSMTTGVPVTALEKTDRIRLTNLEKVLKEHIVGQDEAIQNIAAAIKRSSAGVSDPNRPLGSFIFLGPTGVGKTELAKVLAREVYGRPEALVKIDMSEFMEKHNASRLVGAPPGYVGYEDAGKLTETIRRQPYSVVLLDEIEKAHPDVFNMLLQIMEDGYLTDAKGRRVNFRNTIIIMTSNIGMAELNRASAIGFKTAGDKQESRYEEIKNQVIEKIKDHFRPEFINRLDKIIVFKPLGQEEIKEIINRQLAQLNRRLGLDGISLDVADSAKDLLSEKGFDPEFGARPIRRVITELIEDPLSDLILGGKVAVRRALRVLRKGSKLTIVK
ncbi:MAG TPA: ATP-dependent Clp protease ATP-binding subunit [Candidatus Saccharimonadales bacterium]|nr:ATP-dependent Clp protease ATP-binding subunit [Candidatus Saccharimonadales bacterium]